MGKSWFGLFQNINTTTDVSGRNIINSSVKINGESINGGKNIINIDGIEITIDDSTKAININVKGDVKSLTSNVGDIKVTGSVTTLNSSVGDITIKNGVTGNIQNRTGDIHVKGDVLGSVETRVGDVKYVKHVK